MLVSYLPEPEMALLPILADRRKTSLDVGAANGVYTRHLLAWSAGCISFEPRSAQAAELVANFRDLYPRIRIEAAGLSDRTGAATLRVVTGDPARSTIEAANPLVASDIVLSETVAVKRLDEFDLANIGFIKIDVEGHEEAVLRGGMETIRRAKPNLLIEIEERHKRRGIAAVTKLLRSENYVGYFLLDGRLRPMSEFRATLHQNPANIPGRTRTRLYINNFIFLPSSGADQTKRRLDEMYHLFLDRFLRSKSWSRGRVDPRGLARLKSYLMGIRANVRGR